MAIKNQSITIAYLAWNYSAGGGKTGDASNHTIKLLKDGTEATATNSPSEIDSTNMPGWYSLVLTSGEMNYNYVVVGGKSSTSGVAIFGPCIATDQGVLPGGHAAGASGGLLLVGSGAGSINVDGSGNVPTNVVKIDGQTASASGTVTFPSSVGTSTYSGADTSGTTTLLSRIGSTLTISGGNVYANTQATAASLTFNLTGNVSGSVGSVTGNVGGVAGTITTLDALAAHGDANWGSGTSFALRENTAQGGGASTITLDTGASADNNAYVGGTVVIVSGTGAGQAGAIASYVGSTKVATIYGTWGTNPDSSSVFAIYPAAPVLVQYGAGIGQISASAGVVNVNTTELAGQTVMAPGSGGVTFPGSVGTSTLTQAQVTGGAYALQTDGSGYVKVSSGTGTGQVLLNAGTVTVNSLTTAAFAEFFTTNSGQTFASAVGGSVVYEAGANTTVIGDVTVGGYASGKDPASLLLVSPGNKIATDSSGRVTANTTQLAGQTVTAPGSGGVTFPGSVGTSTLTQAQVTGGAYALQTDGSGYLKLSSGTGAGQIELSAGAVTVGTLGSGAITSGTFASGAITASVFGSGAITSSAFASGAVPASAIFEVDGLTIDSALSAMLATILGVTNVSGNQVEFMHLDGETTKVTVTYGTVAGLRTGSVGGG